MFRVYPIRVCLWRAGWAMLGFSLIASLVAISTNRLASPGIALAPPANGRSWGVFVFECAGICASGWVGASGTWSKWRERALAKAVAVAQAPTTDAVLTWTMKQLAFGALFLVAGIWLATGIAGTPDEEFRMILPVALGLGTIAVDYLILAWRIGKLERANGVIYYWQRRPGFDNFTSTGVYAVSAHAVLW